MLDSFLLPANTEVISKGDSAPLDISEATDRVFLLTLSVTMAVEQEAIEVSVFTSADGTTWDAKPAATLPQKFYRGEYPLLVDLSATPAARFVRARWEVTRWGRGPATPSFEIAMRLREVSKEILLEVSAETQSRS